MADFKATFGLDSSGYKEGVAQIVNETRKAKEATENYKGQLKTLQKEITDLTINYQRLTEAEKNSARGQEMLQHLNALKDKAGEIRDVVADMSAEINALASDTPKLDAFAGGVNLISSAMSSAYTLTKYFSDSEEDATEATKNLNEMIKTLTVIQTTANAAIQIYNALQKQSALMVGVRKAQEWLLAQSLRKRAAAQTAVVATSKAATVTTTANTVATAANTVATNTATVATEGLTVAQRAFNLVAKANPYVLLATAIIAAGSALYYFIQKNEEATEAQKKENEELKKQKEQLDSYAKSVGDSVAKSMTKYDQLRTQWSKLKTNMEKNQFLKDNAKLFNDLGLSINNIVDAEKAFTKNTAAVQESFLLRAQGAALAKASEEIYADYFAKIIKSDQLQDEFKNFGHKLEDFTEEELKSVGIYPMLKKYSIRNSLWRPGSIVGDKLGNDYRYEDVRGNEVTTLSPQKINQLNNARLQKYLTDNGLNKNDLDRDKRSKIDTIEEQQNILANKWKELLKKYPFLKSPDTPDPKEPKTPKDPKEEKHEKTIREAEEEYAKSLQTIAKKKTDNFYTGEKSEEDMLNDQLSAVNSLINFYYDYTESGKKLTEAEQAELIKHIQLRDTLKAEIAAKEATIKAEKDAAEETKKKADELDREVKRLQTSISAATENSGNSTASIAKKYKSSVRNYSPDDNVSSYKDVEKFKDLTNQYDNLKKKIDEVRARRDALIKENPEAKIDIDITGAENALQRLGNDLDEVAKKIQKSFDFKLQKFSNELEKINGLVGNVSTINDWADSWRTVGERMDEAESGFEQFGIILQQTMSTIQMVSSILAVIDTVTKWFTASTIASTSAQAAATGAETTKMSMDAASVGPATAATTALKLQEAAFIDMAAAAMFAAHAYIPFAGAGIASGMIASMMGVLTSVNAASKALAAFENGGIVGGNSWHGDNLQVRVNSGEMIINKAQQRKLWGVINGEGHESTKPEITFKLRGSDIYGSLKNFNTKRSKV